MPNLNEEFMRLGESIERCKRCKSPKNKLSLLCSEHRAEFQKLLKKKKELEEIRRLQIEILKELVISSRRFD